MVLSWNDQNRWIGKSCICQERPFRALYCWYKQQRMLTPSNSISTICLFPSFFPSGRDVRVCTNSNYLFKIKNSHKMDDAAPDSTSACSFLPPVTASHPLFLTSKWRMWRDLREFQGDRSDRTVQDKGIVWVVSPGRLMGGIWNRTPLRFLGCTSKRDMKKLVLN